MNRPVNILYGIFISILFLLTPGAAAEFTCLSHTIVFSSNASGKWDLWAVQPDGNGVRQIFQIKEDVIFPTVSPDGKQILFADGQRKLYIMAVDQGDPQPLPLHSGIFAHPAWRPDGRGIAFVKYTVIPTDQSELWYMGRRTDGWNDPVRLTRYPPMKLYPSYSPDGRYLAYAEFRRDEILGVIEEIGILDIAENSFQLITSDQADAYHPAWSPTGDQIAYASNKTGNYDIWIYDRADGSHMQLTHDPSFDAEPAWSPDGEEIAFVSARTGSREIWVISLRDKRLRQVTSLNQTCSHPFWTK